MPYMRGHVRSPIKDHLIVLDARRRYVPLNAPLPSSFNCIDLGWITAIKDQGGCGSCWDFSGTGVVECAYKKAGVQAVSGGDVILSEQYTLDCGRNGGCNGDDNVTVLKWAKDTGLPTSKDYGAYSARSKSCSFKPAYTLYKLNDWGFTDTSSQDVSSTDSIKQHMVQYGGIGSAVAAGGSWDGWSSDPNYVHKGNSRNIDHDVMLVGWDDAKGAWLMRNSWGTGWAMGGYGWIAYGADAIGTEAVWAFVQEVNPPIDYYV